MNNTLKTAIKKFIIYICRRLGETSPILLDFSSLGDCEKAGYLLDSLRQSRLLEPKEVEAPKNKKILIVAPHPDDEVIGMGGTLSHMKDSGCDVDVVYLTFGHDQAAQEEAMKCADFLGYKCVHFFEFSPKEIKVDDKTVEKFSDIISQSNPSVIFIPFMLDDHDDHRRASELLLRVYDDGFRPFNSDTQIWAYQVYTSLPTNAVVNITSVLDKKTEAIHCYQSRFSQRNWAHFAKGLSAWNVRYLPGNIKDDYAELFLQVSLSNYIKMCRQYFRGSNGACYITKHYNETL